MDLTGTSSYTKGRSCYQLGSYIIAMSGRPEEKAALKGGEMQEIQSYRCVCRGVMSPVGLSPKNLGGIRDYTSERDIKEHI